MIFRDFWVFEHALWQKTKTRKRQKSTESFLNQKIHIATDLVCKYYFLLKSEENCLKIQKQKPENARNQRKAL